MSDTASPPAEAGAIEVPAAPAPVAPMRSSHAAPTTGLCLNCGHPLAGHFCASCGQKSVSPNPTFHDLWHEFTHEMLHVDGRLFRSTKLLFTRPGFLTREYCQGRRARYLTPLRLYLIFSILFFAFEAYFPPPATVRQDDRLGRVVSFSGINVSGDQLVGNRTPEEVAERVQHANQLWVPRLMFVLLPVAALLIMAVTRREKRHFPEHVYFALHLHAAFFGAFLLAHLVRLARIPQLNNWIAAWDVLFVAVYTAVAMHAVYGGSWLRTVVRTGTMLFSYWVILFVLLMSLIVAALWI